MNAYPRVLPTQTIYAAPQPAVFAAPQPALIAAPQPALIAAPQQAFVPTLKGMHPYSFKFYDSQKLISYTSLHF